MRHLLLSLACMCGLPAAEPKIEIFPKTITQTNTTQFDEQGRYRKSSSELRLTVQIKPPAGTQLVASRGVQLSAALSDSGETLVLNNHISNNGEETFHEWQRERNDYDVGLHLANPTKPLGEITSISGVLTLAAATGTSKQAKLTPVKDWLGKPVEIEALHEEITLERKDDLLISGSRTFFDRIQKINFYDASGLEISSSGWGESSQNDDFERSYRVTLPDDGTITIVILPEISEIAVPFTFTKLPVKSQTPDKKPGTAKVQITDVDLSKPAGEDAKSPAQKAEGVKDTGARAGGF